MPETTSNNFTNTYGKELWNNTNDVIRYSLNDGSGVGSGLEHGHIIRANLPILKPNEKLILSGHLSFIVPGAGVKAYSPSVYGGKVDVDNCDGIKVSGKTGSYSLTLQLYDATGLLGEELFWAERTDVNVN